MSFSLKIQIPILYEDDDLLAINKPAGVVVNRSHSQTENTIQDWWLQHFSKEYLEDQLLVSAKEAWQTLIPQSWTADFGSIEEIWRERLGVIHRLDKDTSGILILAKNPGALINLLWQFKQRQTSKTYQALVHGQFQITEGKINAALARSKQNRLRYTVDSQGKTAETFYKVEQSFNGEDSLKNLLKNILLIKQKSDPSLTKISKQELKRLENSYRAGFSLLSLEPKTGRTHQIRVHMAFLKHPLVGDHLYSGKNRNKLDATWCPRHFLHAKQLIISHPRTEQGLTLTAPLPKDLQLVLEYLNN